MPLADHFPRIDDRTEQDILGEALARIPRYTPEWTDYNPGDPGIALLELFSWMSEMLIYRLGRVPELNYLKFLELVGIELEPARPATTVLVFPVQPTFADSFVTVSARTQVAAAASDEDGPILFETERALTALRASLDSVQSHDGYAYSDVSAANTALEGFLPFGQNANAGASLLLGFSDPHVPPATELPPGIELSLAFWPASDRKVPPPAPCGGGTVAAAAPARIVWEFWAGTEWRPMTLLADETLAFTRSGLVRLRTPPSAQAVKAAVGKPAGLRWWIRARLDEASYETAPKLLGVARQCGARRAGAVGRARSARRKRGHSQPDLHARKRTGARRQPLGHRRRDRRGGAVAGGLRFPRLRAARPAFHPQPLDRRGPLRRRPPGPDPGRQSGQCAGQYRRRRLSHRRRGARQSGGWAGLHPDGQPFGRGFGQDHQSGGRRRRHRRGKPGGGGEARAGGAQGARPRRHRRGLRDARRPGRPGQAGEGASALSPALSGHRRSGHGHRPDRPRRARRRAEPERGADADGLRPSRRAAAAHHRIVRDRAALCRGRIEARRGRRGRCRCRRAHHRGRGRAARLSASADRRPRRRRLAVRRADPLRRGLPRAPCSTGSSGCPSW